MPHRLIAVAGLLTLSGCGTVALFGEYQIEDSAAVSDAEWPRLVDVPSAPPPGEYTAAVPDPINGVAAEIDLGIAARAAGERANVLGDPVLSDGVREGLLNPPKPPGIAEDQG